MTTRYDGRWLKDGSVSDPKLVSGFVTEFGKTASVLQSVDENPATGSLFNTTIFRALPLTLTQGAELTTVVASLALQSGSGSYEAYAAIQVDNGGVPSGTDLVSKTQAITVSTYSDKTFTFNEELTAGDYWIVFSANTTMLIENQNSVVVYGAAYSSNSGTSWTPWAVDFDHTINILTIDSGFVKVKEDGYIDKSLYAPLKTVTTTYTAASRERVLTDSSGGAFTITLPSNPVANDEIELFDSTYSWGSYNITLDGNGNNINGSGSTHPLTVAGSKAHLIYVDATQGWRVF